MELLKFKVVGESFPRCPKRIGVGFLRDLEFDEEACDNGELNFRRCRWKYFFNRHKRLLYTGNKGVSSPQRFDKEY